MVRKINKFVFTFGHPNYDVTRSVGRRWQKAAVGGGSKEVVGVRSVRETG